MNRKPSGRSRPLPRIVLALFLGIWAVLAIAPRYRADWVLENLPTGLLLPLAVVAHRRIGFSDRACLQAALFAVLHTIGSHYTYSEVPLGDWLRDTFGLARNPYDRLVHFAFGLLLLQPLRELVEPRHGFRPLTGRYLAVASVMLWSGLYEVTEWIVARLVDPAAGTAYLGTQGDEWDAPKDMACALVGALLAALPSRPLLRRHPPEANRLSRRPPPVGRSA